MAWDGETPIAGAALFKVHNEPLPLPAVGAPLHGFHIQAQTLLVCRSPLADTSALLLPGEPLRDEALTVLAQAAQEQFKRQRCSFLVFDFLLTEQLRYPWPAGFEPIAVSEPGTYMPIEWESFEAYLKALNKKDRQDYKNSLRGGGREWTCPYQAQNRS